MHPLLEQAYAALERDEFADAEALFRQALALERDAALHGLGYTLAFQGRWDEARTAYAETLERARTPEDRHIALHQLGMVERMAGQLERALERFEQERAIVLELGNPPLGVSVNAYELGIVALEQGNFAKARVALERCLSEALKTDDLIARACAWRGLGDLEQRDGNAAGAAEAWALALEAFERAGDVKGALEVRGRLDET